MSDWIKVSEEDAKFFIKNYPKKLEHNFFMDSHSWHDFSSGKALKDSFVVMADIHYEDDKLDWRIHKDFYVPKLP